MVLSPNECPPGPPARLTRGPPLGPESEPDLLASSSSRRPEAILEASSLHPEAVLLDDVVRCGIDVISLTRSLGGPSPAGAILPYPSGDADVRRRFVLAGGDALVEKGAGWPL